jgi:hypothetical protein
VTERKVKPVSMNAFELISKTQGFSLDNLFGKQAVRIIRFLSSLWSLHLKFAIRCATDVKGMYYGGKIL